jgi:BlaI family transcriptional regulator, penicillinase repressor
MKFNIRMFNLGHRKAPTPLERSCSITSGPHPDCTAEMCREGVAGERKLKDSTVRTILRKLEEKGCVTHKVDSRTFVYRAAETRRNVAVEAAKHLIGRFCGGRWRSCR